MHSPLRSHLYESFLILPMRIIFHVEKWHQTLESVKSLHFQFRVAPFCTQFALTIEFNLHHVIVLFENGRSVCTISAVLRFKRNGHRKIIALGNGEWKYEAENIETNYLSNGEFDTFCLSVTALNGSTNYSLKET